MMPLKETHNFKCKPPIFGASLVVIYIITVISIFIYITKFFR